MIATMRIGELPHSLRAAILNDLREGIEDEMPFVLKEVAVTDAQRSVMNELISQAASKRAQAMSYEIEITYV